MKRVSWREFTRNKEVRGSIFDNSETLVVDEVKGDKSFFVIPIKSKKVEKISWKGFLSEEEKDPSTSELWNKFTD